MLSAQYAPNHIGHYKMENNMTRPFKRLMMAAAPFAMLCAGCVAHAETTTKTATLNVDTSNHDGEKIKDDSKPALWVVKDQDTTIYLFGTFHLIKPGTPWFNEAVKEAFDKSDTLVTEIINPEDPATLQQISIKYMVSNDGKKLSERLSPEQLTTYKAYLAERDIPVEAFDQLDPWAVGLTLTLMQYMKSGATPEAGAEAVLAADGKAMKKQHLELENAEQQMQWLDTTPMPEQIESLMSLINDQTKADALMNNMVTAWNAGKPDDLATLINSEFEKSPATAKALLYDRNARWADWIEKRMATPGTVFIAVGAGHLAGKDSVQDYLNKKEIISQRIEY